jgi:hypothetical protein
MGLSRVWTPTGSYSSGGKKRLIVLHTTEGFTGPNGAYDCAHYFQGDVGASAQVCIDNHHPGKLWEGVARAYGSWTQCGYNSVSVSAEQCGYASWTRDYWLNEQSTLLHVTAEWIAEEAKALGIPIRALTSSEAQGGAAGVTYHSRLGPDGCGHSDPGEGRYPIDVVIDWALGGGGSAPAPEQEDDGMYAVTIPPGATADDSPDVAVSLDKLTYHAIGLGADVGRMGADAVVKVRCAWRYTNGSGWGVGTATLTPAKPRTVVQMSGQVDTVSFRRQDDVQITVYPNFA